MGGKKRVVSLLEAITSPSLPAGLAESYLYINGEVALHRDMDSRLASLPNELRYIPDGLNGVIANARARPNTPEKKLADFFYKRQVFLEMPSRIVDSRAVSLDRNDHGMMRDFVPDVDTFVRRTLRGLEILKGDPNSPYSGVARAMLIGGQGSRALKWTAEHPLAAAIHGIAHNPSRQLYPVGLPNGPRLADIILQAMHMVDKQLDVISPVLAMTSAANAQEVVNAFRCLGSIWSTDQLAAAILWNQDSMRQKSVETGEVLPDLKSPGHSDFSNNISRFGIIDELNRRGVRYLIFSNGDEFLFGPDPVLLSIAEDLESEDYGMFAVAVANSNDQFGGGLVRLSDGSVRLVETPVMPWQLVRQGRPPAGINTTFYIMSIRKMLEQKEDLIRAPKFPCIKERLVDGGSQQVLNPDGWAGDVFTGALKTFPLWWERDGGNFLGVKSGERMYETNPTLFNDMGGLTPLAYTTRAAAAYRYILEELLSGHSGRIRDVGQALLEVNYRYPMFGR